MEKQKRSGGQGISWALIILLFLLGLGPIALLLLCIKLFGRDKQLPPSQSVGTGPQSMKAKKVVRKAMQAPPPKRSSANWLKLAGWVMLAIGLANGMDELDNILLFWGGHLQARWIMEELLQPLTAVAAGGVLLASGYSMSRNLRRFQQYLAAMGDREAVSLIELSHAVGRPVRRVEKDLRRMIDRNYFGGRAYIHQELGYLLRGDHAEERLRQKLEENEAKAQAETKTETQREDAPPAETEMGYSGILREIRRANDEIADPILSAKIDRLETIAGKIFCIVEQEPEKAKRISSFFNYYLPTTQKLLDAYAKFERAGVEGENLRQAKARIEATMDSIVQGFEHQLDQLYSTDALDVDQDIRVMEYMLRRDMATVEQDFGLSLDLEPEKQ